MDGTVAVNPQTGERLVLSGGRWVPEAQAQASGSWGPGTQVLPNGAVVARGPRGGLKVLREATIANGADQTSPLFVGQGAVGGLSGKERDSLVNNRDAAQMAEQRISELNRFEAVNKRAKTGGWTDIASALPLVKGLVPNNVELRSITNKIAPTLRGAGSGAMSDKDLDTFKTSIPNVGAEGPTNQLIAARLRAGSQRERDYAAFMDEFARVNGTTFGAQEKWDAYKNDHPLYDYERGTVRTNVPSWREYFGMQKPRSAARQNQTATTRAASKPRVTYTPAQMQAVRSIQGGPRGAGGSRTNPTMISTQAQYNKLPVGAWYIDHLGNYEQKVR